MDQDRARQYNPFAPAMSNSGGAMDAGIPQLDAAQQVAMADQGESAKEKVIGMAMDKGLGYGVEKGAGMLETKLAGLGATSAPTSAAMVGRAGLTGAGPGAVTAAQTAGKGGAAAGAGGAAAGVGAAMAPVLPIIIGAMALKSIFKK